MRIVLFLKKTEEIPIKPIAHPVQEGGQDLHPMADVVEADVIDGNQVTVIGHILNCSKDEQNFSGRVI